MQLAENSSSSTIIMWTNACKGVFKVQMSLISLLLFCFVCFCFCCWKEEEKEVKWSTFGISSTSYGASHSCMQEGGHVRVICATPREKEGLRSNLAATMKWTDSHTVQSVVFNSLFYLMHNKMTIRGAG